MFERKDEQIVITISEDEWNFLLISLGIASGWYFSHRPETFPKVLRLVNTLNEGNPHYTPYEVPAS
jgi:hypothetical protein